MKHSVRTTEDDLHGAEPPGRGEFEDPLIWPVVDILTHFVADRAGQGDQFRHSVHVGLSYVGGGLGPSSY